MVGKGKSIAHSSNAINYVLEKDQAQVLDKHHLVGDCGNEISQEFQLFQELNGRCENNTMSFVISPEIADGKKLSDQEYREIAKEFLQKMNLEKHQSLVVKHQDKEHTHLHIITNRIDPEGRAYKDSYLSKKCQSVSDGIAKERGLVRAKEIQLERIEKSKTLRKEIYKTHQEVLKSNPKSLGEYSKKMKERGLDIKITQNNKGQIQGFRVGIGEKDFKASEIHKNMSFKGWMKNISTVKDLAMNPVGGLAKIAIKVLPELVISKGIGISRGIDRGGIEM